MGTGWGAGWDTACLNEAPTQHPGRNGGQLFAWRFRGTGREMGQRLKRRTDRHPGGGVGGHQLPQRRPPQIGMCDA